MDKILSVAAQALGRRSAKKRHQMLKEKGVDISEYYRNLRRKPNKKGVLTNAPKTAKIPVEA